MSNHSADSSPDTTAGRIRSFVFSYEGSVTLNGAGWFFLILLSYYIVRPIREQISATYGLENLKWLFWAVFVLMLVAIPVFSWLVGKFHRKILVPSIYGFFIVTFLMFSLVARSLDDPAQQKLAAQLLFIWISFYGLFVVSFFWSVLGDLMSTGQGRAFFGYVAGAGTAGGWVGSQIAAQANLIGRRNMLLIAAGALALAVMVYWNLERISRRSGGETGNSKKAVAGRATGGNPFAGFIAVVRSRYLAAICVYGIIMAVCGTSVYFQQSEIVNAAFAPDGPEAEWTKQQIESADELRIAYFARVNSWVLGVTAICQFLLVGFLMKRTGLGWTLAVLPFAYIVGVTLLACFPVIGVLAVVSVLGRSAEYGICNPAREVLFTAVSREQRYKAKSFIDTVVRRGADSMSGSAYEFARAVLEYSMTTLSWAVVPLAGFWAIFSLLIGMENRRLVESTLPGNPLPEKGCMPAKNSKPGDDLK